MSLINQMLRDLEKRRKTDGRSLPSGERPAVVDRRNFSRRLIIMIGGGVVLIGLVWFGLNFFPRDLLISKPGIRLIPADEQSQRVAIVRGQELFAALEEKGVSQQVAPGRKSSAAKSSATSSPVSPTPAVLITSQVAAGNSASTLLNLGVLETIGSARLLFEFEQLPEYLWKLQGPTGKQVSIQFQKTGVGAALKLPRLKGPLLKRISLQAGKEGLQLLVGLSRKLAVKTFKLPADQFHGQRLLVEFYTRQPAVGSESERQMSMVDVASAMDKAAKKVSVTAKKIKKKTAVVSREEQAAQAYRSALELLQRKDYPAAEATLSHALILQPRLLAARLQLIALLQKLQRQSEAEKQLKLGLQLHPDNPDLRKNYARQLLAAGQQEQAIKILQTEPRPEIGSDLEYYALLAALQQEVGKHSAAVKNYMRLLQYRPQESLWWMGLAISLDQAGAYAKAKAAYRQALLLPGLRPDLQDYIRDRLQNL